MKNTVIGIAAVAASAAAGAQVLRFDADPLGAPPAGWTCGVTGRGTPHWAVSPAPGASSGRVLLQSGRGTFPWCVLAGAALADGFVQVRFWPVSGREDQAGGVVWRWQDGDNYYVARANALENNVSLYFTQHGVRRTLQYVDAPVAPGTWHTLRVEFAGQGIAVFLDGTRYIAQQDDHFRAPGAVGVWTKADSVTAFTDFSYGAAR
jgi:hypothetical protein